MKDVIHNGLRVLGGVMTLLAFTALGFFTDNPKVMVPVYFLFFLIVFGGVFAYNVYKFKTTKAVVSADHSKRFVQNIGASKLYMTIAGFALILIAMLVPTIIFRDVGFTIGIHILLIFVTLILIIAGAFAVFLINKKTLLHGIIGYAMLVVISSMPAVIMMQHDRSYHALGTAYYSALIITILAWYGTDIVLKHINLPEFLK